MIFSDSRPSQTEVTVVACVSTYAILLVAATRIWSYDIWGAFVVAPVLVAISLPVLSRVADHDRLDGIHGLLVAALLVKVFMALPRWAMVFVLYQGGGDSGRYDNSAKAVLPLYRQFSFPLAEIAGGDGTRMVASITSGVYTVIGPSLLGGFVVFSWLGFWGLVAMYRAARIALPNLDPHRYAMFVFFLPSMMFWPSSIGKDALLTLAIGLFAYGAARLFTGATTGLWWVLPGVGLAYLIRPHIAAMLVTAAGVAFLFRRARSRTMLTPMTRIASALLVAGLGLTVVVQAAGSLGVEDTSSASEVLEERGGNTSQGGSEFTASPIRGPADVPIAVLTVFYRPFLWEATSFQMLLAAVESGFLLLLTVSSYRRIGAALRDWRTPYVLMAAIYLLGFIYAFSTFGNFGIIARQRVQALPFLLVFLCTIPRPRPGSRAVPPLVRSQSS